MNQRNQLSPKDKAFLVLAFLVLALIVLGCTTERDVGFDTKGSRFSAYDPFSPHGYYIAPHEGMAPNQSNHNE